MSMKSLFEKMNGKRVKKTVSNVNTVEDIPKIREHIRQQLRDNHSLSEAEIDNVLKEDDDKFVIGGSQFWLKPRHKRESIGTLIVRSKDYQFIEDGATEGSWGDKPKKNQVVSFGHKGFTRSYPNGMNVTFEICE
jgi:hypothetical protein